MFYKPVSVAARSKAWVWGRSVAGIVGPNPAGCMDIFVLRVLHVLSGRGQASATSRSLFQRSPTECSV